MKPGQPAHHRSSPGTRAARFMATLAAAGLAACGGGGGGGSDPGPARTAITAAADTLTVNAGETASLISNDRLGAAAATAGTSGNVVFSLTTGALPSGVSITDGVVGVNAAAAPAVLTIGYRICEATNAGNCADGTAQVTIPAPPIVAANDSLTLTAGDSESVLSNDTLAGTAATAIRVLASATGTLPAGVTLSASGLIAVDAAAVPGSYSVPYRICQSVATSNCANAVVTLTVPTVGTVTGRAVDATTASGIAGVTVRAGRASATTDANGTFTLQGVPTGERVSVVLSSSLFAQTVRIVTVETGRTTDSQARLMRVGTTATVAADAGGTVSMVGSTARVVLAANSFQRLDGSAPSGAVTVRMTPIDPAVDSSLMPGDFTTLVSGAVTPIESFGALTVELSDSAGTPVNLRSGQSATIRIPLASRSSTAPASIPLFFFDAVAGRWVQEGSAALAGTAPNQYYEGTVTHFTTWNADRVLDSVRVTGCVADAAGVRQAAARVTSDGIDYSGTTTATTDAAGNFTIALRRSSAATLTARAGTTLSNTVRVGAGAGDSTLTGCLTLGQAGAVVSMRLTWGARPLDLDSHLFAPDGTEVSFENEGSLGAAPFANLDVDDTSSFGPEVVTLSRLMVGTYKYAVHNYSGQSEGLFSASNARVELSLPGRPLELFVPLTAGETINTNWWQLFEMDVDAACNITIRRLGALLSTAPSAAVASTPTYCTRP